MAADIHHRLIKCSIFLTAVVGLRRRERLQHILADAIRLAVWPAAAVLLFLADSRLTVGSWFVSSGFFVPDPTYEGLAIRSALAVWWGTHQMSGYVIEVVALITAMILVFGRGPLLVTTAVFATAALPFSAFVAGHPFRIRYMTPLVAACALFSGLAVGILERWAAGGNGPATASAARTTTGARLRHRTMYALAFALGRMNRGRAQPRRQR